MKLAYIAGPYRGKTKEEVEENIQCARAVGRWVARKGYYPIIPHSNTALFDFTAPDLDDEFWLKGTMAAMEKCDIVVVCPGAEYSSGTKAELIRAKELHIPIFCDTGEIPDDGDFL